MSSVETSNQAAALTPVPTTGRTMHDLIQQAIERSSVKDPAALEAYLAQLEAQARDKGEVTALEIEPGMMKAMDQEMPERAQAFADRMKGLQRELEARTPPAAAPTPPANVGEPTPAITTTDMPGGIARISAASGAERQALIRQYMRAAERLPDQEGIDRLAELNRLVNPTRAPADVSAAETLRARVAAAAEGSEREALIREYRVLISALPEEEEVRRLQELNRLIGATR